MVLCVDVGQHCAWLMLRLSLFSGTAMELVIIHLYWSKESCAMDNTHIVKGT